MGILVPTGTQHSSFRCYVDIVSRQKTSHENCIPGLWFNNITVINRRFEEVAKIPGEKRPVRVDILSLDQLRDLAILSLIHI